MTLFDWMVTLTVGETIAGMVVAFVFIAFLVTRFTSVSLGSIRLGSGDGSILTEIIQREMDLHDRGVDIAREQTIDAHVRMVRDQMSLAEQYIDEVLSIIRIAFVEHMRGLGLKGDRVGNPTYREYLRLERDIAYELRNECRLAMRENGLSGMDRETFVAYVRRRSEALFIRITMTKDTFWASEIVSADDIHNMLAISRETIMEVFHRLFGEARQIATRYERRHKEEKNTYAKERQEFYQWIQERMKKYA